MYFSLHRNGVIPWAPSAPLPGTPFGHLSIMLCGAPVQSFSLLYCIPLCEQSAPGCSSCGSQWAFRWPPVTSFLDTHRLFSSSPDCQGGTVIDPGAPHGLQHLTFSSHHWQGQAFPYGKSLWCFALCLVLLVAGWGFFMALHEKYSIKFCVLLQGPAEPNLKSAERVWSCRGLSPHTGCFAEGRLLWAS